MLGRVWVTSFLQGKRAVPSVLRESASTRPRVPGPVSTLGGALSAVARLYLP